MVLYIGPAAIILLVILATLAKRKHQREAIDADNGGFWYYVMYAIFWIILRPDKDGYVRQIKSRYTEEDGGKIIDHANEASIRSKQCPTRR